MSPREKESVHPRRQHRELSPRHRERGVSQSCWALRPLSPEPEDVCACGRHMAAQEDGRAAAAESGHQTQEETRARERTARGSAPQARAPSRGRVLTAPEQPRAPAAGEGGLLHALRLRSSSRNRNWGVRRVPLVPATTNNAVDGFVRQAAAGAVTSVRADPVLRKTATSQNMHRVRCWAFPSQVIFPPAIFTAVYKIAHFHTVTPALGVTLHLPLGLGTRDGERPPVLLRPCVHLLDCSGVASDGADRHPHSSLHGFTLRTLKVIF